MSQLFELEETRKETLRFLERLDICIMMEKRMLENAEKNDSKWLTRPSRYALCRASMKRASMDLSRLLVGLRKPSQ